MCVQVDFGQAGAQGPQSRLSSGGGELAFPHHQHIVTQVMQLFVNSMVTGLVALKLVAPEIGVS